MKSKTDDQIELIKNDVNTLAESLLEHISGLDEHIDGIIEAITEGIEEKIRAIIKDEMNELK
jgi:hypothetical protein